METTCCYDIIKYGPNNIKSFKILNQGADDATAPLTITYRTSTGTTQLLRDYELTRQVDQRTNTVETYEPTNNPETDNNTDASENSTNSNATVNNDNIDDANNAPNDNSDAQRPDNNNDNADNNKNPNNNNDVPANDDNDSPQQNDNNSADNIEAYTINEPNITLRHTYSPQDHVQLVKVN
ncbi:putative uncharacterized protein DDB_G0283051 [Nasonia vitripennis]|uniref:Uncharacterized protein n=1 Tax=Nasonia vitripennis TaxID=7425 RepID=A0A7M7QHJ0_NASVI|nr:putative uncharacterized protein DDB_G0283051 [Nasonia vitripennis]